MSALSLVQAINLALRRAMTEDPRVLLLGEDVGINGGVFRASEGSSKHSARNVSWIRHSPKQDYGISIGLAVQGFRPVAEIQFTGFVYTCMISCSIMHLACERARAGASPARWYCGRRAEAAFTPSSIIPKAPRQCSPIYRGSSW
jgi:pyruvate/2-oxoglutarate/acetoin dehydrogenase E1 component